MKWKVELPQSNLSTLQFFFVLTCGLREIRVGHLIFFHFYIIATVARPYQHYSHIICPQGHTSIHIKEQYSWWGRKSALQCVHTHCHTYGKLLACSSKLSAVCVLKMIFLWRLANVFTTIGRGSVSRCHCRPHLHYHTIHSEKVTLCCLWK